MSKFALLAIFLAICVSWIYQPFSMNASEEMINKYRPSFMEESDEITRDSIYPQKTKFRRVVTTSHLPKAVFFDKLRMTAFDKLSE